MLNLILSRPKALQAWSAWSSDHRLENIFAGVVFSCAALILFWQLLQYQSYTQGQLLVRNPNLNGDWPLHLQQILSFTHFTENPIGHWPQNPHLAGEPLRYAFGINWLTNMGLRFGASLDFVLLISGTLLFWVSLSLVQRALGYFGVLVLFASGGGWGQSLRELSIAWGPGSRLATKNFLLSCFLPQRGFWMALPIGLYLLRWWWALIQRRTTARELPSSFFFLWAVLPWFHLHTFVVISLAFFLLLLSNHVEKETVFRALRWSPLPLFFLLKSIDRENIQSSVRWESSWMSLVNDSLLQTWWLNWGGWLIVWSVCFAYIFIVQKNLRLIFTLVVALFLFLSHFILAPWAWDQIKVILWCFVLLAFFVEHFLSETTTAATRILLAMGLFAPGLGQLAGGLPSRAEPARLWTLSETKILNQLASEVPATEAILIAPDPHHPIWSTGHQVVTGYPGHLWSHGVNIEGLKESLVQSLENRPVTSQAWQKIKSKFMIWGEFEKKYFQRSEPPAEAQWVKLKSIGEWSLYYRSSFQ
jgi:hypothetical protein